MRGGVRLFIHDAFDVNSVRLIPPGVPTGGVKSIHRVAGEEGVENRVIIEVDDRMQAPAG